MAEPLTAADRSSLNAEKGPVNMAMMGVVLAEAGPGVTYDAICERIAERIHLIPRYRQKLREGSLGLTNPVWVDDEDFDVEWHVRQATLPAPGDAVELADFAAREAARKMERTRPLWELHIVEGLDDGRVALIPKMHHALVDGLAAVGIAMILFDPGPEPVPIEAPTEEWEPEPYDMRRHLRRLAERPVSRVQKLWLEATERLLEPSPQRAADDVIRAAELVAELAADRPDVPELPINGKLSANRSYALAEAPLAGIKDAGKAAGGTVNDAILAVVAGMLRRFLAEGGTDPDSLEHDPVALVPVSIRRDDEDEAVGNRISVVLVELPVSQPDPSRAIEALNARMTEIKGSASVRAGALRMDLTNAAPPLLSSVFARAGGGRGAFNLVVSNVPGPQFPVYLSGSRVHAVHPVVPLNPADQRLNVGVFSYDGKVCFGLAADRQLEPGVEVVRACLEEALASL